jgi:hypothetical protein
MGWEVSQNAVKDNSPLIREGNVLSRRLRSQILSQPETFGHTDGVVGFVALSQFLTEPLLLALVGG